MSHAQVMESLANANRIRLKRAAVKSEVRGGRPVADVLRDLPEELEHMPIWELLCAQQRWGRTRARKFLFRRGINENATLGDTRKIGKAAAAPLGPRRRQLIIDGLE